MELDIQTSLCQNQNLDECCGRWSKENSILKPSCLGKWFIDENKCSFICEKEPKISLVCKDSCPLDNKCYPFGYRKANNYCTDEGNFIEQSKSEEKCDNNFECKSNLCIDSKCISQGMFQKFLSWFKNLFG